MTKIELDMTAKDWERFAYERIPWVMVRENADRFEDAAGLRYDHAALASWGWLHWIGDGWAGVMMCRAYLDKLGHPYELVFDTRTWGEDSDELRGHALLTDYAPDGPPRPANGTSFGKVD